MILIRTIRQSTINGGEANASVDIHLQAFLSRLNITGGMMPKQCVLIVSVNTQLKEINVTNQ